MMGGKGSGRVKAGKAEKPESITDEIIGLIKNMQNSKDEAIKAIEKKHGEELRQIRLELIAVKMGDQDK